MERTFDVCVCFSSAIFMIIQMNKKGALRFESNSFLFIQFICTRSSDMSNNTRTHRVRQRVCVCDISTICKCIESDELSTISILWLLLLLAMSFISSCFLSFVVLYGYFFVCLIRRPVLPWSMRFHFLFNSTIFFAVLLRYFVSLLCFSFPLSVSLLAPNQLLRLFCLCKQIMVCLLVSFKWHNPNNSNYKEDEEQNKK